MNPEIKSKWVVALRSGEYRQIASRLRRNDTYCCLGVLCDLHSKATGREWDDTFYSGSYDVLPRSVVEWAQLDSTNPNVTYEGKLMSLSNLNDDHECNFSIIADVIEASL
jgi:hypothetical protein